MYYIQWDQFTDKTQKKGKFHYDQFYDHQFDEFECLFEQIRKLEDQGMANIISYAYIDQYGNRHTIEW